MYPDTGPPPFSPYFQDFSNELQQLFLQDLFHPHQSPPSMIESSFSSEYDLGGGDLFKELDQIFEQPIIASLDPVLDPMTAAVSMVPFPDQDLSVQNDELFDKVLYECKNDIFGDSSVEACLTDELTDTGIPVLAPDIQLEGSLSCSMAPIGGNMMTPSFLEYPELDFEAVLGMRRAFSNGDIKSSNQWPGVWPGVNSCSRSSEDRQQKLSRYRIKKSKRNFGRRIKYACRKALADSQPRIRGRFAKI